MSGEKKVSSPDYPLLGRKVLEASGNDAGCKLSHGLYIVATPIGHMGDITLRALTVLAQADVIACEDTRTSGVLLHAFGIRKPTLSCHDHNEDARVVDMTRRIRDGEAVALISDAGMPAIADPGFKIVRACRDAGLPVTVIPGANAALTALAGSGLPTDRFLFAGFLPPKSAARRTELAALKTAEATLMFYESPARLAPGLADMAEILGAARQAVVARELTKFYEETRRGTLGELAAFYAENSVKGEVVILVERGGGESVPADIDALLRARLGAMSVRDAVAEVAAMTGIAKKQIYARALALESA
ncbi:MAG: 16S rRNA (cytidine(1402)-2'-O)-methyltransferase [Alphaproteobacteria bacterium]|nr:16S rRNA (cytidine(1402)-2'-O)-methyltransferase [Alphaproteobacteria bacterium]